MPGGRVWTEGELERPDQWMFADESFAAAMAAKLTPIALRVAQSMRGLRPHEREDLRRDLVSSMWVSAPRYDKSKASFFAFAKVCMFHRAVDFAEAGRRRARAPEAFRGFLELTLRRPGAEAEAWGEAVDMACSSGVTERGARILAAYMADPGMSKLEAAAAAGMGRKSMATAVMALREARGRSRRSRHGGPQ